MVADPFIEDTELELGHVAQSCAILGFLMSKLLQNRTSRERLTLFSQGCVSCLRLASFVWDFPADEQFRVPCSVFHSFLAGSPFFRDLRKLEGGLPLLKGVVDLSTAEVKDVGQFQEQLVQLVAELKALEPGKVKMVPGGWDGATGASTVVHLVEKEGSDTYAFVTCNAGKGLIYHPCTPAEAPKIKYKTCLRIGRIPADRMTSMAFWSVLLSQWMKVRFSSCQQTRNCQHGLPDPVRAS